MLLTMRDVSVTYRTEGGEVPAVQHVDLTVTEGEIVGLAGESGCGKSTLASTVLWLQPKSARITGEIMLLGQNVAKIQWGELRALRWAGASIVFQGALHSLNPVQRVGRQISEAITTHDPHLRGDALRGRVAELLEMVGLASGKARNYPHQLSGGQRQRIMIAMALACRPQLIVADEPTTALDVMVQAQVLDVLRDLVRDLGVGMLIISHDLSVLADLCDRIVVMYAGRVIETGSADDFFHSPLHPYSAALSASFPRVGDPAARFAPAGLPGDPPDPAQLPPGCAFASRCSRVVDQCHEGAPPLAKHGDREVACIRVGQP